MYHILKDLEVLFSSTAKVTQYAVYIMYTYGVYLCDVILVP